MCSIRDISYEKWKLKLNVFFIADGVGLNSSEMSGSQHYSLRWNNHQSHLLSAFDSLLQVKDLVTSKISSPHLYVLIISSCEVFTKWSFLFLEWVSCWLHNHVRGLSRPRSQGGLECLQSLLPEDLCGQPWQASHRGAEGCPLLGDAMHPGLHVQGGDLGAGAPADQPHQGRGESEGARADLQWPAASWCEHQCQLSWPRHQPVQWIWAGQSRLLSLPQPRGTQLSAERQWIPGPDVWQSQRPRQSCPRQLSSPQASSASQEVRRQRQQQPGPQQGRLATPSLPADDRQIRQERQPKQYRRRTGTREPFHETIQQPRTRTSHQLGQDGAAGWRRETRRWSGAWEHQWREHGQRQWQWTQDWSRYGQARTHQWKSASSSGTGKQLILRQNWHLDLTWYSSLSGSSAGPQLYGPGWWSRSPSAASPCPLSPPSSGLSQSFRRTIISPQAPHSHQLSKLHRWVQVSLSWLEYTWFDDSKECDLLKLFKFHDLNKMIAFILQ